MAGVSDLLLQAERGIYSASYPRPPRSPHICQRSPGTVLREMPLTIEERALSPHPDPLPWGEGESLADLELANRFCFVLQRAVQFPLPKGEGQGEGKHEVSKPDARNNTSVQGFKAQIFRRILSPISKAKRNKFRRSCPTLLIVPHAHVPLATPASVPDNIENDTSIVFRLVDGAGAERQR